MVLCAPLCTKEVLCGVYRDLAKTRNFWQKGDGPSLYNVVIASLSLPCLAPVHLGPGALAISGMVLSITIEYYMGKVLGFVWPVSEFNFSCVLLWFFYICTSSRRNCRLLTCIKTNKYNASTLRIKCLSFTIMNVSYVEINI
jgi:hypothetical protein